MAKKSLADRFLEASDSAAKAGDTLAAQRLSGKYSLSGREARRPVSDIPPRPSGNTREIDPLHVLDLAESIDALGLLQPIAIDKEHCLVAGEHRLEACRLLSIKDADERQAHWEALCGKSSKRAPHSADIIDRIRGLNAEGFKERYKDGTIPVLVLPFSAKDEQALALAAETAENEKRRNYTREEILTLAGKLRKAGYVDRAGRPKAGEKSMKKALTVISGKSWRQIYRDMTDGKTLTHVRVFDDSKELRRLRVVLAHFLAVAPQEHPFRGELADFAAKVAARLQVAALPTKS